MTVRRSQPSPAEPSVLPAPSPPPSSAPPAASPPSGPDLQTADPVTVLLLDHQDPDQTQSQLNYGCCWILFCESRAQFYWIRESVGFSYLIITNPSNSQLHESWCRHSYLSAGQRLEPQLELLFINTLCVLAVQVIISLIFILWGYFYKTKVTQLESLLFLYSVFLWLCQLLYSLSPHTVVSVPF